MEVPVRMVGRGWRNSVGVLALGFMLASCAAAPARRVSADPNAPVSFPNGRVTVILTDETGQAMDLTRVNFSWEKPTFYKTSAFTDMFGRVTFSGVPTLAQVSIDYPGGLYSEVLIVPQIGSSELRLVLETYGQGSGSGNAYRQ